MTIKTACWNPKLFPDCQYCQWLFDVNMKVGKKFINCPRLEAKQMRVWITQGQLSEEKKRHINSMKWLTEQLCQYTKVLRKGQK